VIRSDVSHSIHSRKLAVLVIGTAGLLLAACSETEKGQDSHVAHWGYEVGDGPAEWAAMNSDWHLCAVGSEQSPIDLVGGTAFELPDSHIQTPSAREVAVLNHAGVIGSLDNGHTIQVNAKTGEHLTIGEQVYELLQFHFHAPSEHTLAGEHYPMEVHFVHQAENGAIAVLGVFVEEGADNPGIVPLWNQLTEAAGSEAAVQISTDFADRVFPGGGSGVYHYTGSLTTPPCSEEVSWFIRKTPTQLSKDQIGEFTAVYNHNNRPVQALNDRTLYMDSNPTFTID
jgi:carbonic anhydrase